MSVLDDIFSQAAEANEAAGPGTSTFVNIAVTIIPSSNLNNGLFDILSLGWSVLWYTPATEIKIGKLFRLSAPFFENEIQITAYQQPGLGPTSGPGLVTLNETIGLTITGPIFGSSYTVGVTFPETPTVSFTAQVDPTTNVVYGPAGTNFIAISFGILDTEGGS